MIDSIESALAFIHDATYRGGKNGLENMRLLMSRLGDPHKGIRYAHVTGTNGKGSVCAFIQAALREAGYRTGLYTSPFLQRFNERIRMNGAPISDEDLIRLTGLVKREVERMRSEGVYPTEFEITTAIGFLYLREQKVDVAVIEVGLGGRLDSTNIIEPMACAITSIGLDHTKTLGGTVEQIAYEKAGIAKPGIPMILYPCAEEAVTTVVASQCAMAGAPLVKLSADDLPSSWRVGLDGAHQYANAATAVAVLNAMDAAGLPVGEDAIRRGIARTRWPGRMEWVTALPPLPYAGRAILLDGAHNPHGARALADSLANGARLVGVVGMLRDKDAQGAARELARTFDRVYTVTPDSSRALPANELAEIYQAEGVRAAPCASLGEAMEAAARDAGDSVRLAVTGSLYLIGEARTYLRAPECGLLDGEAPYA